MSSDGRKDSYELTYMLLASLAAVEDPDDVLRHANGRLANELLLWLATLRKRPLTSCYEFITPPSNTTSRAGWYWRHPKQNPTDFVNWHGPYASRKEAIEARLKAGPIRTSLDVIERDIFR